jgi:hypothetical protein
MSQARLHEEGVGRGHRRLRRSKPGKDSSHMIGLLGGAHWRDSVRQPAVPVLRNSFSKEFPAVATTGGDSGFDPSNEKEFPAVPQAHQEAGFQHRRFLWFTDPQFSWSAQALTNTAPKHATTADPQVAARPRRSGRSRSGIPIYPQCRLALLFAVPRPAQAATHGPSDC